MSTKSTGRKIANVLGTLIVMPIWYYLLYKILRAVNATELMMFLYWIYIPVGVLVNILTKLTGDD